jgi:hypothetical protein
MKRFLIFCTVVWLGLFIVASAVMMQDDEHSQVRIGGGDVKSSLARTLKRSPGYGDIPLYFIPNRGQVHKKALFYARASGYTLWLTTEGLVFDSIKQEKEKTASPSIERDVTRLVFLDANPEPELAPHGMTQHRVNYIKGKDRSKWRTGIKTSKAVLYKNLYPGIDLKTYGVEREIEYDWLVKPGGSPAAIQFKYEHAQCTYLNIVGDLVIKTKFGELVHKKPVGFQLINGKKVNVPCRFERTREDIYGFKVENYDKEYELTIDPVVTLDYSTYLGGLRWENCKGIAVNESGEAHVVGNTTSYNFPTKNAYDISQSSYYDSFLTKFTSDGRRLLFSTYFGGRGNDDFNTIALAGNGDIYIGGKTSSWDLPYNNNELRGYIYIARFSSDGNFLGGQYLGAEREDKISHIALDDAGNVFITGDTGSIGFPVKNPYQHKLNSPYSAYVCKLSPDISTLLYSTYLGGYGGAGWGARIVVDKSGFFYVAGCTGSRYFPVKNAYQQTHGGGDFDAFITKFKPDGSGIVFSTYLGGNGDEFVTGLALDSEGNVIVGGTTNSYNYPRWNPFQSKKKGGTDIFITKLKPDGSGLVYSTYLGGFLDDTLKYCVVDAPGNLYVTGYTGSWDFPLKHAYQTSLGGSVDGFVSKIAPDGKTLDFSTYIGGSGNDYCRGVAIDNTGRLYICGDTGSNNFPFKNAFQSHSKGEGDAFLTRLLIGGTLTVRSDTDDAVPISVDSLDLNGNASGLTDFTRSYEGGTTVTLTAPKTFNSRGFNCWEINGVHHDTRTVRVAMNGDCTANVKYCTSAGLMVSCDQLVFGCNSTGLVTGPQRIFINNSGESTLNWTAGDNASWLMCRPGKGTGNGEVSVSVNGAGCPPGIYNGTVTVSAPGAENSPQYVNVTFIISGPGETVKPFGAFDRPLEGSTIRSSVPFCGWALDDIEIESVKIYRQEGSELIYVGDGVMVDGARPDVEEAYSNYPKCNRAGWGYMMLTNFLPNGGNGKYTFHAVATDIEGNRVTLGKKTVVCDNANAVKPFGAIDTPGQGGTASGARFVNFGWVLTPLPNKVPLDGSTIDVWVDGVKLGHPTYNQYRADIAILFPGYANSEGAVGYYSLDTTAYANGVHTIQWTATDDAGNTDGIGSRYFTVSNSTQGAASKGYSFINKTWRAEELEEIPVDYSTPVGIKKGYNKDMTGGELETVYPGDKGFIKTRIKELGRLELHFGRGRRLSGGLKVADRLRPLPVGSYYDPDRGIFCWQAGPGFVGEYRFIFIGEDEIGNRWRKNILVTVEPEL